MADQTITPHLELVEFRGNTLIAVVRDDAVYIAINPICSALKIDARKQRKRILEDPDLAQGVSSLVLPSAGGMQEMTCLKIQLVAGWLFMVNRKQVKPEAQELMRLYRQECLDTLHKRFFSRQQTVDPSEAQESEQARLSLVREARMIFGVAAAAQLWFAKGLFVVPRMVRVHRQMDAQGDLFDREQEP